ncbi:MAG: hypothetical protein PHQ52_00335 [Candidatus Omnitrophica bacterium]|nr:hypothetical protein [Candidatus Omnitrophota bacterium]
MKKCPFCSALIQDMAKKCRHCGKWVEQRYSENIPLSEITFPDILPGLILSLCLLFLTVNEKFVLSFSIPLYFSWKIILLITGYTYFLHIVSAIHHILLKMSDDHYPITPKRAVLSYFVPIYNIYWIFKWPADLLNYLRTRDAKKRLPSLFPGFIFFLCLFAGVERALFMHFLILYYLMIIIKNNIVITPVVLYSGSPKPSNLWPLLCLAGFPLIVIFFLLLGIFYLGDQDIQKQEQKVEALQTIPGVIFLTNKK